MICYWFYHTTYLCNFLNCLAMPSLIKLQSHLQASDVSVGLCHGMQEGLSQTWFNSQARFTRIWFYRNVVATAFPECSKMSLFWINVKRGPKSILRALLYKQFKGNYGSSPNLPLLRGGPKCDTNRALWGFSRISEIVVSVGSKHTCYLWLL